MRFVLGASAAIAEARAGAAEDLKPGQVLMPDGFDLNDAMSAIEMLDPKMDCGAGAERIHLLQEKTDRGASSSSLFLSLSLSLHFFFFGRFISDVDRSQA